MIVIVEPRALSDWMMRLEMPMDDFGVMTVVHPRMNVLCWQQRQPEHAQGRQARNQPTRTADHHWLTLSGSLEP
jgi:hypothetical protein